MENGGGNSSDASPAGRFLNFRTFFLWSFVLTVSFHMTPGNCTGKVLMAAKEVAERGYSEKLYETGWKGQLQNVCYRVPHSVLDLRRKI